MWDGTVVCVNRIDSEAVPLAGIVIGSVGGVAKANGPLSDRLVIVSGSAPVSVSVIDCWACVTFVGDSAVLSPIWLKITWSLPGRVNGLVTVSVAANSCRPSSPSRTGRTAAASGARRRVVGAAAVLVSIGGPFRGTGDLRRAADAGGDATS